MGCFMNCLGLLMGCLIDSLGLLMDSLVSFLRELFRPDTEEEKKNNSKISDCWEICFGRCMYVPTTLCPWVVTFFKVYNGVSFVLFFFTAFCFSINLMIELTLEPLAATKPNLHIQRFYIACTFLLLVCLAFNCFYFLSLFWDVVKAATEKTGTKYNILRFVSFVLDLIVWEIFFSQSNSGFTDFLRDVFIISYYKAGVLTILGSVFLVFYVYTKRNTVIFPLGCGCSFGNFFYCIGIPCFHILYILSPVAYKLYGASVFSIALSFFIPYFSAGILAMVLNQGSKKKDGGLVLKVGVFVAMIIVYIALTILASSVHYQCGPAQCQLKLPMKKTGSRQTRDTQEPTKIPGYPICDKRWSKLGLSITDMAFFADLAYKIDDNNKTKFDVLLKDYFHQRSLKWTVESMNNKKPSFYHIYNGAKKVHIIGIRGTSDGRDWIENLKIWNEIAIFQLLFGAFSTKNLPESIIANYVRVAAVVDYILDNDNSYVKKLEDYSKKQTTDNRKDEFVLVGHSLGGGLANIVGAMNKIPAIAFSSPGEVYNHLKYGYTLEDLEKYTTSFGAKGDIMSWIDQPGGLVQNVKSCDNCGFLEVHSIKNTFNNLKKKCPIQLPCLS